MTPNRTPKGMALVLVALALVTASCRRPVPEAELGIQRIALSLAFSEEELKVPVEPEVILRIIPAPPTITAPDLVRFQGPPPAAPVFDPVPLCPVAGPGSAPEIPAVVQTFFPPSPGLYPRVNKGTISVVGGVLPLTLPYPPLSEWTVRHGEDAITEGIDGVTEDSIEKTWTIRRAVTPSFVVTDSVQLTDTALQLTQRVTEVNGVVSTFTPTPAVDVYTFGVEGDTWVSAGVDPDTNTAMYVSGAIVAREIVDACGELVDTYRFTLEEQFVNLDTGETSGTPLQEPNTYNIATQYGALLVKESVHTLTTTQTPDGAPLTYELTYTSVIDTLTPGPLPPEDGS